MPGVIPRRRHDLALAIEEYPLLHGKKFALFVDNTHGGVVQGIVLGDESALNPSGEDVVGVCLHVHPHDFLHHGGFARLEGQALLALRGGGIRHRGDGGMLKTKGAGLEIGALEQILAGRGGTVERHAVGGHIGLLGRRRDGSVRLRGLDALLAYGQIIQQKYARGGGFRLNLDKQSVVISAVIGDGHLFPILGGLLKPVFALGGELVLFLAVQQADVPRTAARHTLGIEGDGVIGVFLHGQSLGQCLSPHLAVLQADGLVAVIGVALHDGALTGETPAFIAVFKTTIDHLAHHGRCQLHQTEVVHIDVLRLAVSAAAEIQRNSGGGGGEIVGVLRPAGGLQPFGLVVGAVGFHQFPVGAVVVDLIPKLDAVVGAHLQGDLLLDEGAPTAVTLQLDTVGAAVGGGFGDGGGLKRRPILQTAQFKIAVFNVIIGGGGGHGDHAAQQRSANQEGDDDFTNLIHTIPSLTSLHTAQCCRCNNESARR